MPLSDPQPLVDRLSRKQRRLVRLIVAADLLLALLLGLLVLQVLESSRRSYEQQARAVAEGIATVAQFNIASELGRADAIIRATTDELQRLHASGTPPSTQLLNGVLQARLALLPGVEGFRLADAEGKVRWGNKLAPGAPVDLSDREYFQQAMTHHDDSTIVAGPLRSRVSGQWVVVFVRPLWRQGRFDGILYASVVTDYFHRLFSRYDLGERDAVTLRHQDLRLVARRSPGGGPQGEVGTAVVSPQLMRALQQDPLRGAFVSRVAIDDEMRTTAYRAVEGWPFTVYAGVSHRRFFQGWEEEAWRVSGLSAAAWLLVAGATLLVYRASGRQARAAQALADQTTRLQALLHTTGDGIHIVNHHGRLVEMSDAFAEMLGSTREALLGRHVSSWDANQDEARIARWLAHLKDGDRQRVDVQHRREDGSIIDVDLQMSAIDVGGELLVFASGRDVTAVKRLMREQAAMLDNDLVGMARVEHRRFSWTNAAFDRLFGYERGELQDQSLAVIYRDERMYERAGQSYGLLQSGPQYRSELPMRRKNGDPLWVDLGAALLGGTQVLLMAIDVSAAKAVHEQLAHAAFHDALTQLPNRLLLRERLAQALAVARREHTRVAVCYLDLDGFKAVNDQHGHDAGDELLRTVARRIADHIRPSDTAARLGGDEFVLLLTDLQADEWRAVVQRVRQAVEQPVVLRSGVSVGVGATCGVALSRPEDSGPELLDRADRVMFEGKRAGKGRVLIA